jgi:NDP-sugar pyrophosphorylase family protein
VILAGGLATRMLPRTRDVPKILLPVAGRPFADRLLERLGACGYDEIVLCVGHLGDAVHEAVGDGARFGLRVRWSDEGARRLGTAGALRLALPLLAPTFLVTYGDSFLPFDYAAPLADLEAHDGALGTMTVYENHDLYDASNTRVAGDRVVAYAKRGPGAPRAPGFDHIDYGAIALRREVVAELPEGAALGLDEVQGRLARSGRLRAYAAAERFFEIGSEDGLADLERALTGAEARA